MFIRRPGACGVQDSLAVFLGEFDVHQHLDLSRLRVLHLKHGPVADRMLRPVQNFHQILLETFLPVTRIERLAPGDNLCGGQAVDVPGRCARGWFIAPTVIEGLSSSCRTNQEEIFGPVVTLMPFDDDDEAIALANATQYGLAASVWTTNLKRAHRIGARLESGIVWINCWMRRDLRTPFGGVKQSGVGREGGVEALRFFTETKNVCIDLG